MDTRVDVYKPEKIKVKPYEHHVKYYETDQMRIVHHSNYIRWMEEARMDMMEQMGFGYDKMALHCSILRICCPEAAAGRAQRNNEARIFCVIVIIVFLFVKNRLPE